MNNSLKSKFMDLNDSIMFYIQVSGIELRKHPKPLENNHQFDMGMAIGKAQTLYLLTHNKAEDNYFSDLLNEIDRMIFQYRKTTNYNYLVD